MADINAELELWKDRVFFPDEKFKENTPADLNKLVSVLESSRDLFTIISSETEACVYKIGRFMVEHGLQNRSITFIDGDEIENYIDINTKYAYQAKAMVEEFMEHYGPSMKNKWVFIPYVDCQWNSQLVHMFITGIKKHEALGLLFYSPKKKPDGLAQILCEDTYIDATQFPKALYKPRKETHQLEKDVY